MNRLCFLAFCLFATAGFAWSGDDEYNPKNKVYDLGSYYEVPDPDKKDKSSDDLRNEEIARLFNGKTVYFLDGFNFEKYKSGHPDMTTISMGEVDAIKNGTGYPNKVTAATGPYSVIGHSQGGLRALGYISFLKRSNAGSVNNLDSVITISGVDQGLKALDGGLAGLKARASEKINILGNGLRAAIGIFDDYGIISILVPRNKLANTLDYFLAFIPKAWQPYFISAWQSTSDNAFPQIRDMVPRSNYIKQNVAESVDYPYKVKTGQELACEWRYTTKLFGIKIWYLWIGKKDVYATYVSTEVQPKFDSSVPVGFIVGLNSKTLNMMSDSDAAITKGVLKGMEIGFAVVEGFHIAKCIGITGLFTGSVTYAADADRARKLMGNFESELNDLKRSSENDGLVAAGSQYIPTTFTHPTKGTKTTPLKNPVLGGKREGFVGLGSRNHTDIIKKIDALKIAANMADEGFEQRKKQGLRE